MKNLLFILCGLVFSLQALSKNTDALSLTLDGYTYPYAVEHLTLESQQQALHMAYMDVKPEGDSRGNVLLLHGKNFNGAYWQTTIAALNKQGYRVIVPDQIGFGKSAKPQYYQYSFHQLAQNTKQLLDQLGVEQTAVLGHSMGGMLAARFALMYPETTEKLVLVNPIGLEDYKVLVPYQSIDWWYKNELGKDRESIKQYQKKNYYDGKWKAAYDPWVDILAGWTNNPKYPLIAWNAALTYDMIFTQPVVYEFGNIESPTLLIIGTRDRTALGKPLVDEKTRKTLGLYQKLGKTTQQTIPNAQLVELDDIGHLPHIEAFDRYIKPLLAFLKADEPKQKLAPKEKE